MNLLLFVLCLLSDVQPCVQSADIAQRFTNESLKAQTSSPSAPAGLPIHQNRHSITRSMPQTSDKKKLRRKPSPERPSMFTYDGELFNLDFSVHVLWAHHYGRKADQLMAKEKYEEAVLCHSEAAELLKEALSMTASEQVRLSLELQRDWHLHQQRLIQMSCEQAKLKGKLPVSPITQDVLHSPPIGWKAAKDDRTRLEEQSTAIADLWKLLAVLLLENKSLMEEQKQLKEENEQLRRERDHHSPPASPDQPSSLSVRLLDVTPDLQHELQQLLEMANHN